MKCGIRLSVPAAARRRSSSARCTDAALREARPNLPNKALAFRDNNNLPLQLTSFIGRERQIERLKTLLSETRPGLFLFAWDAMRRRAAGCAAHYDSIPTTNRLIR